jgi:hypothetical protein
MKTNKYAITGIVALAAAVTLAAFTPRLAHAKAPDATTDKPPINGKLPVIVKSECWLQGDKKICRHTYADGSSRDETVELGKTRDGFIKPKVL